MSKEDFVKFYEDHVLKNPSLKSQLDDANGREAWIKLAMAEGSKAGLSFTQSEMQEVMDATEKKTSAQLSDDQLDQVVGGAGTVTTTSPTVSVKTLPTLRAPTTTGGATVPNLGGAKMSTTMCCW